MAGGVGGGPRERGLGGRSKADAKEESGCDLERVVNYV